MHDHIINVSDNEARRAATELTNAVSQAAALAGTLSGWQSISDRERRVTVSELVKHTVLYSQTIASWAEWKAGSFDTRDNEYADSPWSDSSGRFMICWTKKDNQIKKDRLNMQDADWLRYVLDNPEPHFLKPQITMVNGIREYVSSAVAPIYNSNGEICAMAGVDVNLEKINSQLASLRLYSTGYGIFISGNGFILGHKDPQTGQMLDSFRSRIRAPL